MLFFQDLHEATKLNVKSPPPTWIFPFSFHEQFCAQVIHVSGLPVCRPLTCLSKPLRPLHPQVCSQEHTKTEGCDQNKDVATKKWGSVVLLSPWGCWRGHSTASHQWQTDTMWERHFLLAAKADYEFRQLLTKKQQKENWDRRLNPGLFSLILQQLQWVKAASHLLSWVVNTAIKLLDFYLSSIKCWLRILLLLLS